MTPTSPRSDFAMREAFAILRTNHDGRGFDLYRWIVDVRLRADGFCGAGDRVPTQRLT